MEAEQIASDVAKRVRAIVSDAEQRAAQIIREAEDEAQLIRTRAEQEGRGRLDDFRRALDELQGKLGAANAATLPGVEPGGEIQPGPVTIPEPTPPDIPEPGPEQPLPEPTPEPPSEPEPPLVPEPTPPPDEGTPPSIAANGRPSTPAGEAPSADTAAARLVAMNMALDGASREAIEAHLAESYALDDAGSVVDDVFALTSR